MLTGKQLEKKSFYKESIQKKGELTEMKGSIELEELTYCSRYNRKLLCPTHPSRVSSLFEIPTAVAFFGDDRKATTSLVISVGPL